MRATDVAILLENKQTDEWIWQSLALGKPIDGRFDRLVTTQLDYTSALVQSFQAIRGYREELAKQQTILPHLSPSTKQQLRQILREIWSRLKNKVI